MKRLLCSFYLFTKEKTTRINNVFRGYYNEGTCEPFTFF